MGTTKTPTELAGLRILGAAGVSAGANETQVGASGWLVVKTKEAPVGTKTIDQSEYDALVAKAAKADALDDAASDPVAKAIAGLPDEVKKAVEAGMAELKKTADQAQADAADAASKAEALRLSTATKDAEALAKSWEALPVDAPEFAPEFVKLTETAPDLGEFVSKMMTAANEAAKLAGITKAAGRDSAPERDDSSDPFVPLAKAMKEKDPSLSYHAAYAKAVDENPGLYAQHRTANLNPANAD